MDASGKVLLVDEDVKIQLLLRNALEQEGFQVVPCRGSAGAISLCRTEHPVIVILETSFNDGDGFGICRAIRSTEAISGTPVIFLTARASEEDRLRGLDAGANDYIVKPFSVRELVARVKAHLRSLPNGHGLLRAGQVELDASRCRVRLGGSELTLTGMEFRLLEYFMRNLGHVLSRKRLLNAVWPPREWARERTVDVHVARLRAKIEFAPESGVCFRSVRGFGYSLEIESCDSGRKGTRRAC